MSDNKRESLPEKWRRLGDVSDEDVWDAFNTCACNLESRDRAMAERWRANAKEARARLDATRPGSYDCGYELAVVHTLVWCAAELLGEAGKDGE